MSSPPKDRAVPQTPRSLPQLGESSAGRPASRRDGAGGQPGARSPSGWGSVAGIPGRWHPLLLAALLVLLALPPRLLDTGRFVTTDELFWVGRAAAFGRAIETGQFAQTFQTGHPGVTTMWTAWLGMGSLAHDLAPSKKDVSRREVSQSSSFMAGLAAARRAFGVVTALGIGVLALLAWRLFGPGPAALGGLLLAVDPFFLAHSRLVHIDASLTLWMSLAVVSGLARWQGGSWWTLALCGISTGLALLSKSPALMLLGLLPIVLLPQRGVLAERPRMRAAYRDLAIWAGLTVMTFAVVWPAVWSAPDETLSRFLGFVRDNANPENAAAADEQGIGVFFYPLVFLLRTTPLTWLGLLGLMLPPWHRPASRTVPLMLVFVVGFGAAMTVAAKEFDRYLLPIFPTLDLLAGLGLWRLIALILRRVRTGPTEVRRWQAAGAVAGVATVVMGFWWIWSAWPYELTYANPLLGGNQTAHRTIASGWGEGLDEAARYLNEHATGSKLRVAMPGEIYTTVLGAQVNGTVAPAEGYDAGTSEAFVVYQRNIQLGERPPFFDETLLTWTPDYTVVLNGVPYAWVYSTHAGAPVAATFGDALVLDGYGLDTATPRIGRRLELRLRWRALTALPKGLGVIVELRPESGRRVQRLTLPLEPTGDPSRWATEERMSVTYQLPLDSSMMAGDYVLAVKVIGADGEPLPVTTQPNRPPGVPSEPDAVPLRHIQPR